MSVPVESVTSDEHQASGAPRQALTLFDSVCIIVGIVIGAGLYETSPTVAMLSGSAGATFGIWALGGAFALIGALCYAELATAYPADGGDFYFLSRAWGGSVGFLFAWVQLWIVRPGSIGAMAYVFARYANQLWPAGAWAVPIYAVAAVVLLALVNVLGVRSGKAIQNLLTLAKVGGLVLVFIAAMMLVAPAAGDAVPSDAPAAAERVAPSGTPESADTSESATPPVPNYALAMILVMFTYGGWNEMAYVAAEVRNPRQNIFRALLIGTLSVAAIYLLMNMAFLQALGFEGVVASQAVAADVASLAARQWGARAVSLLICVSALGAINGMIFTGSRIYYAMGKNHALFAPLGHWNARFGSPVLSITVEATICVAMIGLLTLGYGPGDNGFQRMLIFGAPPFWFFLALTGLSLIVLRWRDPGHERPVRVPLYPLVPLVFIGGALAMAYSAASYANANRSWEALWALGMIGVGGLIALRQR